MHGFELTSLSLLTSNSTSSDFSSITLCLGPPSPWSCSLCPRHNFEICPPLLIVQAWLEHNYPLPPQPTIPSQGQVPYVETDDGGIYAGAESDYSHIRMAERMGVPPARIMGGGFIADGVPGPFYSGNVGAWVSQEQAKARIAYRKGWSPRDAREGNPIYEKKLGPDEAQARATHLSENEQAVFLGYMQPNGTIVYAEPPDEVDHSELSYGMGRDAHDSVSEGWVQFRAFPDDGTLGMRGLATKAGRARMVKLARRLQEGNPPFRLIEVEFEYQEGEELYKLVSFHSMGEFERGMAKAREGNPITQAQVDKGVSPVHQSDGDHPTFFGWEKPNGTLVYGKGDPDVRRPEIEHSDLARAVTGKKWKDLDYGISLMTQGWIQFRHLLGELSVTGLVDEVPRIAKLAGKLSRMLETRQFFIVLVDPVQEKYVKMFKTATLGEFMRQWESYQASLPRKTNPGIVKRFAGGVLGKAKWILPFHEYIAKVQFELERRGLHPKGQPLESHAMDALRVVYDEAVEEYRRGGPDAVDEWVKGYQGKRKGNPELPEFLWAIDQGKILFYALHHARYEVHEDWLGSPKWKWDAKNSKLCRGRLLAYPETKELYISSYKTTSVCPMAKVKSAFQTHFSQYADYVWTSDSAKNPRCGNPIDMLTLLGAGVIAGAVQGIVEPYVTKHVYGVENPIHEKGIGRAEAQGRAMYVDTDDEDDPQTSFAGFQKPNGELVYGDPAAGDEEQEHSNLAHTLTGKNWKDLDYGLSLRQDGWIIFRVWPELGHVYVRGLETPSGRSRAMRLIKLLQVGYPPFIDVSAHLLYLNGKGGHGAYLSTHSVGEMGRVLKSPPTKPNPVDVTRHIYSTPGGGVTHAA